MSRAVVLEDIELRVVVRELMGAVLYPVKTELVSTDKDDLFSRPRGGVCILGHRVGKGEHVHR